MTAPPIAPPNAPLNANDVLQRFANPGLAARYHHQEQQHQERQSKSDLLTPQTPASVAARGNMPAESRPEASLMAAFSTAAVKRKAEEEEARQANDPTRGLARGGGRSR